MILGISASARQDGETAKLVKAVLEATGRPYEFISLQGKKISGCIGCLKCAKTGQCVIADDWIEIGEKMKQAIAIVFGAPAYTFNINALGHAFLERTYAFRHFRFLLGGKYGVVVTPNAPGNASEVYIEKLMTHNKMVVLDKLHCEKGIGPCWDCGKGSSCYCGYIVCENGNVPFDELTEDMRPLSQGSSKTVQNHINAIGWKLAKVLEHKS